MSHRVLKEKVTRDRSVIDEIGAWASVAWQRLEQQMGKKDEVKEEWDDRKKRLQSKMLAGKAQFESNRIRLISGSECSE